MDKYDFINGGRPVRLSDSALLSRYYQKAYDSMNPPVYLAEPAHAEMEAKRNIRYVIMPFGHDEMLVVYKVTRVMGADYVHVFDKPISISGDADAERKLIGDLKSGGVSFLVSEKYLDLHPGAVRKENYDNYYYDLEMDRLERFSNGRWRRKSRASLLGAGEYRAVCTPNFNGIMPAAKFCRGAWWSAKGQEGKDMGWLHLLNTARLTNGEFMHYAIFHKDACLAFSTDIVSNGYAVCIFCTHIGRTPDAAPEGCDHRLVSNLDDCLRYVSGTWLLEHGISREYCLGFGPGRNAVRRHKEATCAGKIKYFVA